MTTDERRLIDNNLKNFDSFIEFHKFLFFHNIELSHDEWEEYRDNLFDLLPNICISNSSESIVSVDLSKFVMPR